MFDDLPNGQVQIALGSIPVEEWRGGFLGMGRSEAPDEEFLITFRQELEDLMKQIDVLEGHCPGQYDSAWEGHYWKDDNGNFYEVVPAWFDRIDKICDQLNITYVTHEEEADFDALENFYPEEMLYHLDESEKTEEWYGERREGDALPSLGLVCRTMTKQDFKLLLVEMKKLLSTD